MNYSTIPTVVGAAKLRNASLLGQKVDITRVAFGDGDGAEYEPTGQETALKKQVYECQPNRIEEEAGAPSWIELEAVIPHNVGGWHLREVGCFDDEGDLIFIGNIPSSFKPSGEAGVIKDLIFEMVYDAVAADVVQIKIDPNVVIATRKYVDDQDKAHTDAENPHSQYEKYDNAASNQEIDSGSTASKHIKLPQFWRGIAKQITARFSELKLATNVMSFVSKAGLYTGWNNGVPVDSGGLTSVVGNQLQIMSAAGHATQLLFGDGYAKFRPQWGSGRWVDFFTTSHRPKMSDISGMTMVAMVNFDGITPNVPARSSFNIQRIIDNGVGDYTIEFENPVSIEKRVIICGQFALLDQADAYTFGEHVKPDTTPTLISETQIRVLSRREQNVDVSRAYVIVFGELA